MGLRVGYVSYSDNKGGAALAAVRMQTAYSEAGGESDLLAVHVGRARTRRLYSGFPSRARFLAANAFARVILAAVSPGPSKKSLNLFGSGGIERHVAGKYDVIHLHWVHNETLSLDDIRRLPAPVVWTLHDAWFFSGVDHLGGRHSSLQCLEAKKQQLLRERHDLIFTVPTSWGRDMLLQRFPQAKCVVIPNPVDVSVFGPGHDRTPMKNGRLSVLFSSAGGLSDPNKGFDLLLASIERAKCRSLIDLHVVGSVEGIKIDGVNTINHGRIKDQATLAAIYRQVDLVAVPSRFEMFGQVAVEGMACGKPVICFNVGGLPEVVVNRVTGIVVAPFDTSSLAEALDELSSPALLSEFGVRCIQNVEARFDTAKVGSRLQKLYAQVCSQSGRAGIRSIEA